MKKRKSFVRLISEWPRRSKELGWGFRHDEVWFEVNVSEVVEELHRTSRYATWDADNLLTLCTRSGLGSLREWDWTWPDGRERHYSREFPDGEWRRLYMRRRMLYLGGFSLPRIHTFFSGDEEVPHDHPFAFWTFPLSTYVEEVELDNLDAEFMLEERDVITSEAEFSLRARRTVRRLRPHFRPALYRHVVLEPDRPVTTIVLAGRARRRWGFWPEPDVFVDYEDWTRYEG